MSASTNASVFFRSFRLACQMHGQKGEGEGAGRDSLVNRGTVAHRSMMFCASQGTRARLFPYRAAGTTIRQPY